MSRVCCHLFNVVENTDVAEDATQKVLKCIQPTWALFDKRDKGRRKMHAFISVEFFVGVLNATRIDRALSTMHLSVKYLGQCNDLLSRQGD